MEQKYSEISQLLLLQQSILKDGEIKPDESGFFTSKDDKGRTRSLEVLQDKYTYGWYIAEQSKDEQIKALSDFIKYVVDNYYEIGEEE